MPMIGWEDSWVYCNPHMNELTGNGVFRRWSGGFLRASMVASGVERREQSKSSISLCLFKLIFYFLPWCKSRLKPQFGTYFLFFSNHQTNNSSISHRKTGKSPRNLCTKNLVLLAPQSSPETRRWLMKIALLGLFFTIFWGVSLVGFRGCNIYIIYIYIRYIIYNIYLSIRLFWDRLLPCIW